MRIILKYILLGLFPIILIGMLFYYNDSLKYVFAANGQTVSLPFNLKTGHPRVFIDQEKINELKQVYDDIQAGKRNTDLSDPLANALGAFLKRAREYFNKDYAEVKQGTSWDMFRAIHPALAYRITGDTAFKNEAIEYLDVLVNIPLGVGDDTKRSFRIKDMGILYDWLFDELTASQKFKLREKIKDMISYDTGNYQSLDRYICGTKGFGNEPFTCADPLGNPLFINGHAHSNSADMLAGLLAIADEAPEVNNTFIKLYDNFVNGYNPARKWISVDGGHQMGWSYGATYSYLDPIQIWESATDAVMKDDWQGKLIDRYIYGLRGNMTFPASGDYWIYNPQKFDVVGFALWANTYFNHPVAKWFYKKYSLPNMYKGNRFNELLYYDAQAPESSPDNLPLSKHFKNAGQVLMRDSFNYENAALVEFKSSSFETDTHKHKDQNAFTIFYKSPLAIDSGIYDSYGSSHFRNYYRRTIAHNTITVFNPNERFKWRNRCSAIDSQFCSNDGGQMLITNPSKLEEIKPGGYANVNGILNYEYGENGDYTYVVGDATKSYSANKLSEFKRSLVFLKNPKDWGKPILIVFDRVVSANPDFKKIFLLHSVNEPQITGSLSTITNNAGKLFMKTVLPVSASITKVGGQGKEFWVDDNGNEIFEKRENYPPDPNLLTGWKNSYKEAGSWRIEVSPQAAAKKDIFLNVLSVADSSRTAAPGVSRISGDNIEGVIINKKQAVVFNAQNSSLASESFNITTNEPAEKISLLITGLLPNAGYNIKAATINNGYNISLKQGGASQASNDGAVYLTSLTMVVAQDESPFAGPQNQPPIILFTSPKNNASYSQEEVIAILAKANDDGAVTKVEFYDSSALLGVDDSAPYSFNWNTENIAVGSHDLIIKAYDDGDPQLSSAALVKIRIIAADTAPKEDDASGQPDEKKLIQFPNIPIRGHVIKRAKENQSVKYFQKIIQDLLNRSVSSREKDWREKDWRVVNFMTYGASKKSKSMSQRDRKGVITDFIKVYNRAPSSSADWDDVAGIIRGRRPSQRDLAAEKRALADFGRVYKRMPDFNNIYDEWALYYMAYNIRPRKRNISSEKFAIRVFKSVYGQDPDSASDWATIRAIAYTGAVR